MSQTNGNPLSSSSNSTVNKAGTAPEPWKQILVSRLRRSLLIATVLLSMLWVADRMPNLVQAGIDEDENYDLSSVVVLTRAVSYIRNYYYDPARIHPQEMLIGALEGVAMYVPSVMIQNDEATKRVTVFIDKQRKDFSYAEDASIWDVQYRISEVFAFIQPYLDKEVNKKEVEYAAINGMLDSLDPHSVHMLPKIYTEMRYSTSGKFGGLGILISVRDGNLTVISPLEDTPAWKVGIKSLDHIVTIDGQSTVNMNLEEAVNMMRGDPGTPCKLTIMRKGFADPKPFTVIRDIIKIKSVDKSKMLPGKIGYLSVNSFSHTTEKEAKAVLDKFHKKVGTLNGLILDLRGNPGGVLDAAIDLSNLFLRDGVIVATTGGRHDLREESKASRLGTEPQYPIVVLIDSGSASASEIVSGALKNNNRAVVIGEQSFGKGSVQQLYEMADQSALKLTIAQYLTPGDVSIQGVGITPDISLTPIYIDKEGIEFYSSDRARREQDLDHHLTNEERIVKERPFENIRYLWDKKRDEPPKDSPSSHVLIDFPVTLAQKVLQSVNSEARRPLMLQKARKAISSVMDDQDKAVEKKLKTMAIDWSQGTSAKLPKAEVSVKIDADQEILKAGEKSTISLTVKNVGEGTFYRLRCMTDSEYGYLDGREFLFGKVKPGESITRTVEIELPKDALARTDPTRFVFVEQNGMTPPSFEKQILIEELPRPQFTYSYRLEDQGNGDGRLQVGEQAVMTVLLGNVGEGVSPKGMVNLKNSDNLKDLFIHEGRVEYENLEPGKTMSVSFRFELKPNFNKRDFKLDLSFYDSELRLFRYKELNFKVEAPKPFLPAPAGRNVEVPAGTKILGFLGDTQDPVIAITKAPTVLKTLGVVGTLAKVSLADGATGFIRSESTLALTDQKPGKALAVSPSVQAPIIGVDMQNLPGFTTSESITLSGLVQDDNQLLDMYIVRNRNKVFYLANPDKNALKLGFEATIPLEEGVNRIHIVARESHDFRSERYLVINRPKAEEDAQATEAATAQ